MTKKSLARVEMFEFDGMERDMDSIRAVGVKYHNDFNNAGVYFARFIHMINESDLYIDAGFDSIARFCSAEYGIGKSAVSKYLTVMRDHGDDIEERIREDRALSSLSDYYGLTKAKKLLDVREYQKLKHRVYDMKIAKGAYEEELESLIDKKKTKEEVERKKKSEAKEKEIMDKLDLDVNPDPGPSKEDVELDSKIEETREKIEEANKDILEDEKKLHGLEKVEKKSKKSMESIVLLEKDLIEIIEILKVEKVVPEEVAILGGRIEELFDKFEQFLVELEKI